jgi:hypothetical protein
MTEEQWARERAYVIDDEPAGNLPTSSLDLPETQLLPKDPIKPE